MLITEDEQLPLRRTPFYTLPCMLRSASDENDEKLWTFRYDNKRLIILRSLLDKFIIIRRKSEQKKKIFNIKK